MEPYLYELAWLDESCTAFEGGNEIENFGQNTRKIKQFSIFERKEHRARARDEFTNQELLSPNAYPHFSSEEFDDPAAPDDPAQPAQPLSKHVQDSPH